jgi:chemotaxis protein methyltransferase WspC
MASEEEMDALVDQVVVPETWFFRDRQAFRCLRRQVVGGASRAAPEASLAGAPSPAVALAAPLGSRGIARGKFRVLSIPCCTGEEPYSIAMLLLDAGLTTADFEVIGVDVSPAALATAAIGNYPETSFRETEVEFVALQHRYCRREATRRVVAAEVRATVHFLQANLAGPQFLAGEAPFHAIFCRNLFIYLDQQARETGLAHLRRLLLPGGMLYLAAVEAGALATGLHRLSEEFPFVFTAAATPHTRHPRPRTPAPRPTAPAVRRGSQHRAEPRPGPKQPAVAVSPPETKNAGSASQVAKARQAADAGRLTEAAAICADLAAQGTPQPDVFCLLGVVRQAQGDLAAAEQCFQRALYLDSRHAEALVHMALLARLRGDERSAEHFLRRAGQSGQGG